MLTNPFFARHLALFWYVANELNDVQRCDDDDDDDALHDFHEAYYEQYSDY